MSKERGKYLVAYKGANLFYGKNDYIGATPLTYKQARMDQKIERDSQKLEMIIYKLVAVKQ